MPERVFIADEWEYGLRCGECHEEFAESQPIAERLDAFQDDVPMVTLICVACDLAGVAT